MLKTIAPSLAGLVRSVEAWVATGNEHRRRFIWHKSADQILDNLTGYLNRISNPRAWAAAFRTLGAMCAAASPARVGGGSARSADSVGPARATPRSVARPADRLA